jgi:hypothetical protein
MAMKVPSSLAGIGVLIAVPLVAGCHREGTPEPLHPASGLSLGAGHLGDPKMEAIVRGGRGYQGPRKDGPAGARITLGPGQHGNPQMEEVLRNGGGYQGPRKGGPAGPALSLGTGHLNNPQMESVLRGGGGYQGPRKPR